MSNAQPTESIVLGGGCFWCLEAAYQLIEGVSNVTSGYAGGHVPNPTYMRVASKTTGHAEVVQIEFNPNTITVKDLLDIFWVIHDPTTPDRQGYDQGPEYRSIILYNSDEQKRIAEISRAEAQKVWENPIVTEISPLVEFYKAEPEHQNFYRSGKRPDYCEVIINPKLAKVCPPYYKEGRRMINTLTAVNQDVLDEIAAEKQLRQTSEVFLLFALGSQFDHLIKLQLDRLGIYCLVADPEKVSAAEVKSIQPTGIILSGGPGSALNEVPPFDAEIFDLGIPVLGICLGFQLWAAHLGAQVASAQHREFGTHPLRIKPGQAASPLLQGIPDGSPVLQSHGDHIEPGEYFDVLASTDTAPVAAGHHGNLWGVQYHPEVTASKHGAEILENFCRGIAGAKDKFPAGSEAERKIKEIQAEVGAGKVLLALSGGSDSSVVATLLSQSLKPEQIRAVYIRGIDRPDDEAFVHEYFAHLDLVIHDATDEFLQALAGATKMHDKRVAMRGVYKAVLEAEAKQFGADFIAQGTLYTDLTESGGGHTTGARKAQIKLHHNAGLNFDYKELTPLDDMVKDTARAVGRSLGTPEELLVRHPFPGPGLVVRIEGEVTAENLHIARQADGIYLEELRKAKLYETVWQAGAVVTHSVATYSKGDDAGSGLVLALWAVWSVNGFTAEWAELPYEFLRAVSRRITNEIPAIASVVYRISDKPPATIEWG
jgi:GMP synthase (glutamine-hydrolysing)